MARYRGSMSDAWGNFIAIIVVLVILAAATGGCGAMTSKSKAIHAAEDAGYTNIKVVGKAIWFTELRGCGKEDNARFTVRGTNVRGEVREFYVCAGVLKGGTIRSK